MTTLILKDGAITLADGTPNDVFAYPDGQRCLKLQTSIMNRKHPVTIRCRIKSFADMELLLMLTGTLIRNDYFIKKIEFVYLYGMRSDRAFSLWEPNYFEDILKPIIKRLPTHSISIFFPHSERICDDSVQTVFSNDQEFFDDFCIQTRYTFQDYVKGVDYNFHVVGADASSSLNYNAYNGCELPHFEKQRRLDGVHADLKEEWLEELKKDENPIFIVDDLCDGGATFIAIGKFLQGNLGKERDLRLCVAHGLFSKGFEELFQYYWLIHTTNSYQDFKEEIDIYDERLQVMQVI